MKKQTEEEDTCNTWRIHLEKALKRSWKWKEWSVFFNCRTCWLLFVDLINFVIERCAWQTSFFALLDWFSSGENEVMNFNLEADLITWSQAGTIDLSLTKIKFRQPRFLFFTFHLKEGSLSFKNTSYHALQWTLHCFTSPFYSPLVWHCDKIYSIPPPNYRY